MLRREFLKNSLAMTSMTLFPKWVYSQEKEPHFILQFYMEAGWDTTLMTEAWNFQKQPDPKSIFIEYSENDLIPFGSAFLAPAIAPLKNHFQRMTVFNGVMMSPVEVGHPSPEAFSITGASDGSAPAFVCQFVDSFFQNKNAAIVANTSLYTNGQSFKIETFDGARSLSVYSGLSSGAAKPKPGQIIAKAQGDLVEASKFLNSLSPDSAKAISSITNKDIQILAKGFMSQMFPAAFVKLERSLDTHNDHVKTHLTALKTNFETIASYLDGLKSVPWNASGKSLLDLTTIVISSDFTRTPALNVSGGKDHNPFSNSMIVFSPKMKSEIIIGRSRLLEPKFSPIGVPALVAVPLDTETLVPVVRDPNTTMLNPSVIYGSILDAHGKINGSTPDALKDAFKLKGLYRS